MEDHLEKILYLVIGIFYTIFIHIKKRNTEEQRAEEMPEDLLPPSASEPDWGDAWKEATQEVPATTLYPQATQTPSTSSPVHPKPHSTPQIASQKQSQPKIDRMLGQYSGLKKAMIINELIRPHRHSA